MGTAALATKKEYVLSKDEKFKYTSFVLLQEIIQYQHYFPEKLEGDDKMLEDNLKYMQHNALLEIKDGKYIPTAKGREYLVNFFAKYFEFLKIFDVFSMVDMDKGEFALSHAYDEGMTDELWAEFKKQERFSDVRVAVCEFKGINPIEVVFMSFLQEERFDALKPGWQKSLTGDDAWGEIINVCNTAIPLADLQADDVILNIVKNGSAVMKQMRETEARMDKEDEAKAALDNTTEEVVTTTTEEVEEYVDIVDPPFFGPTYFDPYYMDPFYISPIWIAPILFF